MIQSVLSLNYVRVPVAARAAGSVINPTTDTVAMAFTSPGVDPVSGDWKTASWETDSSTTPDTYFARCLVGPSGTLALMAGTYDVWVRVTDNPEVPVELVGQLEIV